MKRLVIGNSKLSLGEQGQLVALYQHGFNIYQLSGQFKITPQAVHQLLKRRGIPTRPRWPKQAANGTKRADRDEEGIIVTLRDQQSRELYSLHVPGFKQDALRHVAEIIDGSGRDWRLLCYSTPALIAGDLSGPRLQATTKGTIPHTDCPEAQALSKIKRLDLLDPALDRGWQRKKDRRE